MQNIHSKKELEMKILHFLDQLKNTKELLIIVADSHKDCLDRLSLVKTIIKKSKTNAIKKFVETDFIEKHFVIVVKIYGRYEANLSF